MITQEELKELISLKVGVEKLSTLSSDGKNLLTRVPRDVELYLDLQKGNKIRWMIDTKKKIKLEVVN